MTSWWQLFAELVGTFALAATAGSVLSLGLGGGFHLAERPWDPSVWAAAAAETLTVRSRAHASAAFAVGLSAVAVVQWLIGLRGGDVWNPPRLDLGYLATVIAPGALALGLWGAFRSTRPDLFPGAEQK